MTRSDSPSDTFVTALQAIPDYALLSPVPTTLFQDAEPEPRSYMERAPDDGVQLLMADVDEAAQEEGDTDSTADAEDCTMLEDAAQEAFWDRVGVLVKTEDDVETDVLENDFFKFERGNETLSFPKPPREWTATAPKEGTGEPEFCEVDNPGKWSQFTFRPKFIKGDKKKNIPAKYANHTLPTGARPVPKDESGDRKINGWGFQYEGWVGKETADLSWQPICSGASRENPFPPERRSFLDYGLLKQLGTKKQMIVNCDALFFYQLLLPFGDPKKKTTMITESGEQMEDPRMPYYSEVERFTAKYAAILGMGGSYGHHFVAPRIPELAKFDCILIRDGVLGGSKGSIHLRWKPDDALYNSDIAGAMTHTRFLQIKRTFKLNDNDATSKDPCKKFDYIYRTIVHNTNALSKYADSDQCLDETTFGHAGYGPSGTGVMRRLIGKKVNKGGQTVLCADVSRNRVRAYTHRHKCHEKPKDWNREGCCELRRIAEALKGMVIAGEGNCVDGKALFRGMPHLTGDNYFGDDRTDEWMGENGLGFLHTVRRDCLPSQVPDWAWHKVPVVARDQRARVSRFQHPITAVKSTNTYTRVHVSFQSTGPTNLSAVNSLNANSLFSKVKCRGAGKQKRRWVIEMNDARQLYLGSYGRIDTIDSLLVKCAIFYRTLKYWHAAKNHALALAVVTAYDIYLELATEQDAKVFFGIEHDIKPLSFHQFRDTLSLQGLHYNPILQQFAGDGQMRVNTKVAKEKRRKCLLKEDRRKRGRPNNDDEPIESNIVTPGIFTKARKNRDLKKRFCGSLTEYVKHESSIKYLDNKVQKKGRKCYWCGESTWSYCGICKDPVSKEPLFLHHCPRTGSNLGKLCFTHAHNEDSFGLGKKDYSYIGAKQKQWSPPTKKAMKEHCQFIDRIRTEVETDDL